MKPSLIMKTLCICICGCLIFGNLISVYAAEVPGYEAAEAYACAKEEASDSEELSVSDNGNRDEAETDALKEKGSAEENGQEKTPEGTGENRTGQNRTE